MIWVEIPSPLRTLTGDKRITEASGNTLEEIIENLEEQYPGIKERLINKQGAINRFVIIFLDDEDVRYLTANPLELPIPENATIKIIPQMAGG